MVLTEELEKELVEYLEDVSYDFDKEEIQTCFGIIKEKKGKRLSELDNTLLLRIIEDEKLIEKLDEITDKDNKKNIFD